MIEDRPEPREQRDSPGPPSLTSAVDEVTLRDLHLARILDFLNIAGFGHSKDRRAAGFQPHGFAKESGLKGDWTADRIDLIGLVVHPEPVVYLTDRLPTMTEARTAKTRKPDAFEADALAKFRAGGDLVTGDGGRMVGSIRSANQCVECHGGNRGDLLGAFSYRLRKN